MRGFKMPSLPSTVALFLLFSAVTSWAKTPGAGSEARDSTRAILQRYADAWRGKEELELPEPLVLAFSIRGEHGGEYSLELSNKPGMHINAKEEDQRNDFLQGVVVTRGRFRARLDGKELALSEGQAVFIPPGMTHEFWADPGQYEEFVFMAFGDGA